MELFSVEGRWWLAGRRDDVVAGKLCESEGGSLSLQLQGTFSQDPSIVASTIEQQSFLIQGVTANSKMMTLSNCISSGNGYLGFPGYARKEYWVGNAYIGDLLEKEDDLVFDQAQLTFPHLSNWLDRQVFSVYASRAPFDSIECSYKRPEDIEASVRGGGLRICSTVSYQDDFFHELMLKYTPVIQVNVNEKLTLPKWEELYFQPIRDFLTFALRHRVSLSNVALSCKERLDQSGRPTMHELVLPGAGRGDAPIENLHPNKILFSAKDADPRIGDVLSQWLSKYAELRNVMMLFFAPIYNEHMYLEHQFLNLAYATETYHRMRYPGNGKRTHFKDRIFSLLSQFEEPLKLFPIDYHQFAEKVTNTRNFYVHYDDTLRDKAANGEAFVRMLQVLQSLIEVCLLSELGLDLTTITMLVARNATAQYTARIIREKPELFV